MIISMFLPVAPIFPLLATISIIVAEVYIGFIRNTLENIPILIDRFIEWHKSSSKSIYEILRSFYGSKVKDYSFFQFNQFKTSLNTTRQAIMCYWNKADNDGNVVIAEGAHFVYLIAEDIYLGLQGYEPMFKALNNGENKNLYLSHDINDFFGDSKLDLQFLWGYIIH